MGNASTITLSTGRELQLRELNQVLTYDGLLEGVPNTTANKHFLDGLVAREKASQRAPVHVVAPVETPIDLGPGHTYSIGSPARLPRVTCIGRFQSQAINEAAFSSSSELTIIWWQDEFALPIAPSALESIAGLDWPALAEDDTGW